MASWSWPPTELSCAARTTRCGPPLYLLLNPIDEADPAHPVLVCKNYPVDESPRRRPMKVAQALTTWEP